MAAALSILIFWSTFLTLLKTKEWWMRERDPVEVRLSRLLQPEESETIDLLADSLESKTGMKTLKETLVLAGLRRRSDLDQVLTFRRVCQSVPLLGVVIAVLAGYPAKETVILGGLLLLIFVLIPRIWLLHRIVKRRREIERALPEALDLFVLSLEAGLSFDACLVRVSEEERRVSTQMSRELMTTNREILAGKPREEALRNLAWRCGVQDLQAVVGAILQSVKLGTSLVKTLRVQADTLRKKKREGIRAQILKTPVKLIFPLLFFIFPTLLIVILGPSLINIFRHLRVGS